MCVVTPIKSMKHKYELLLNGCKMSESVEIEKSTMFYLIGTCSHLFLCKALSVQKVVPTLTSKSAEISPSMAGAKQDNDTGLSGFRPWVVRQVGVCSGVVLRCTVVLVEGSYKRGERGGEASMSLRFLIEAECQYRGCRWKCASMQLSIVPPAARGLPPPFISQGEAVYSHAERGRRGGEASRSRRFLIEAECQYRGCRWKCASMQLSIVPPTAMGPPPPFISQEEAVYSHAA
jgi:hypothetical protein